MLVVQDLSVFYGESQILSNVSLQVQAGQVVSLMGRNGVGKTTLLKSIMGLLKPKAGQVYLMEVNVTSSPAYQRARSGIGYVPQGRGIFPYLTVEENLLLGLEALPASKRNLDSIEEIYDGFPALRTYRRKVAGTLSGGQQQQLAFGRALVRRPTLLLLDEPTEGIQPSIVDEIEQLILSLREQRTKSILLVEQFLDFAMTVSDYCYVMEKGSIVLEGATNDLEPDVIQEYLAV